MNWISVKDRMPEEGEDVLIWVEDRKYEFYERRLGFHRNGEWYLLNGCDECAPDMRLCEVFQWMPLPDKPS